MSQVREYTKTISGQYDITDNERGIPNYGNIYDTENEACDALLKKISRSKRIYQKNDRLSE
jgi:hypothetical protein